MADTDHHMLGFSEQESLFLGLAWVHPVWAAASGHSTSSTWEAQRDPATPVVILWLFPHFLIEPTDIFPTLSKALWAAAPLPTVGPMAYHVHQHQQLPHSQEPSGLHSPGFGVDGRDQKLVSMRGAEVGGQRDHMQLTHSLPAQVLVAVMQVTWDDSREHVLGVRTNFPPTTRARCRGRYV